MDLSTPSIFPTIFPPLFTLLVCTLMPLLAFKERRDSKPARWFSILCVLVFVYNLLLISVIVFAPSDALIALVRLVYPMAVFFLPLAIEPAHQSLGLQRRTWLVNSLFIVATIITLSMWVSQPAALSWFILALCLAVFIYAITLLVRGVKQNGMASSQLYIGVIILAALNVGAFIPVPGLFFASPLSLAFIPLSLIALGLDPGGTENVQRQQKRGVLNSLALAFIVLPLSTEIIILLYSLQTINLTIFWNWLIPYGIIIFFSIFVCITMANFCLRRTFAQRGSLLFAIVCLLWCMNNIQDILLVIFPEDIAVQAAVLNDAYLVTLAGFLTHLLCVLGGKPKSRLIPISYAVSFTLMPLIIFQTNTNHIIYHYASGPFIKAEGIVYDLFALHLFTVLIVGAIVFGILKRKTTEILKRRQYTAAMLAAICAALLLMGTIPSMSGYQFYPFQQLIFIALAIIGYGIFFKNIVSAHSRRTIIARQVRATMIFTYIVIALLTAWVLDDYSWHFILERITLYGLPALISCICAVFLSLFVLSMEQNRNETYLFSVLCLVLAGVNIAIALLTVITDPRMVLAVSRIENFFVVLFLLGGFLHLAWLTAGIRRHWWIVYLGYGVGLLMAPFTLTEYFFSGVYAYSWGMFAKAGILHMVMSSVWLIALFVVILVVVHGYRTIRDPLQKRSRRYIVYSFGAMIILSLTDVPAIYGYDIYPLGTFIFIPLIFLAYGLFKHNLFLALQNVRAIIASVLQICLITLIALLPQKIIPTAESSMAFYGGILLIFFLYRPVQDGVNSIMNLFIRSTTENLKQQYYGLTQELSLIYHIRDIDILLSDWFFNVLIASRCLVLIRKPNEERFEGELKWNPMYISGIFSSSHPTESNLPVIIGPTHPLIDLSGRDLPIITQDTIEECMHTQSGALDDWLTQAELILPISIKNKTTAMIILGGKMSGLAYNQTELEFLRNLGPVLGPNIENARLLEGLEKEVDRRTEDLNAALIDSLIKEKEITESNTIIIRQNEIFRSLLETSTQIHQIWKLDALFVFTLEQIHTLFPELGFGIILEGGRSDIIESIAFVGIEDKERDIILANREMLLDDDIDGILYSDLLVKGVLKDTRAPEAAPHWTVLPMMLSTQRVLGKMIIKGNLDQTSREVISVFLGQLSAVTQSKLLMRELEKMASMDGLTGVYNRSFFNQEHMQAIANANRYRIPFAIIMIDVNELKRVNDFYGHERGDEMIVRVAHLIKEVCRKTDVAARIGGDEFAALMPSTTLSQAEIVVQRLRSYEEHLHMLCKQKDGHDELVPIRISIGLSASDEVPTDDVFKEADKRMYLDKEHYYAGRERYR